MNIKPKVLAVLSPAELERILNKLSPPKPPELPVDVYSLEFQAMLARWSTRH